MAKTELKTKVNDASVAKFLNSVADEEKRKDCFEILKLMKQVTKEEPKMWGSSIVGFGVPAPSQVTRAVGRCTQIAYFAGFEASRGQDQTR